jgi:hypothetical protein
MTLSTTPPNTESHTPSTTIAREPESRSSPSGVQLAAMTRTSG